MANGQAEPLPGWAGTDVRRLWPGAWEPGGNVDRGWHARHDGSVITFIGADEEKAQAMVDEDGHFEAENVPSGEVRVTVVNSPLPPKYSAGRPERITRGGHHLAGGPPETTESRAPVIGKQIPKRYENPDNGLTIEIQRGDNSIDIDLKP